MRPVDDIAIREPEPVTSGGNTFITHQLLATSPPRWYAVYTRARTEKQAYRNLIERGFNAWLPLYKTLAQWSDRKKMVEKPLLNSYLFVKITNKDFYTVQGTMGVSCLVKCQGRPVPIPQDQIDNLKLIIDAKCKVLVTEEKFEKGNQVVVTRGTLKGLEGELISDGNRRVLIVRIDSIEKNIIVKVPPSYLKAL